MDEHIMLIRFKAGSEYEACRRRKDIIHALYPLERMHGLECSEVHRAAALIEQDGGAEVAEAA